MKKTLIAILFSIVSIGYVNAQDISKLTKIDISDIIEEPTKQHISFYGDTYFGSFFGNPVLLGKYTIELNDTTRQIVILNFPNQDGQDEERVLYFKQSDTDEENDIDFVSDNGEAHLELEYEDKALYARLGSRDLKVFNFKFIPVGSTAFCLDIYNALNIEDENIRKETLYRLIETALEYPVRISQNGKERLEYPLLSLALSFFEDKPIFSQYAMEVALQSDHKIVDLILHLLASKIDSPLELNAMLKSVREADMDIDEKYLSRMVGEITRRISQSTKGLLSTKENIAILMEMGADSTFACQQIDSIATESLRQTISGLLRCE
jgi:hypothetical protein